MKAHAVVDRLLEDDLDDARDLIHDVRQFQREQIPPELRDLFQKAPEDFFQAFGNPQGDAVWEPNPVDYPLWPEQDGYMGNEAPLYGWEKVSRYPIYEIHKGRLLIRVMMMASYGFVGETCVEWYTPENAKFLREQFHYKKYHKGMARYFEWVAAYGGDPLGLLRPNNVDVFTPVDVQAARAKAEEHREKARTAQGSVLGF